MDLLEINISADEVKELGDIILDDHAHLYGFTVTLKNGTIRNIYLKGNAIDLKDEIANFKNKYKKLEQEFKKTHGG